MSDPLASSWAKYLRASHHLKGLQDELVRVRGPYPEAIDIETKVNTKEAFAQITRVPDLRDAGLFIGDAVTNYRAALDHLVWDLVKLGTHRRLTAKQALEVQYPLAKSWAKLARQRNQRVPGITDDQWAIIRAYQPYRRDERGRAMRLLRNLSDMDKHRFTVPSFVSHSQLRASFQFRNCRPGTSGVYSERRPLRVGTKLVWTEITPTSADYNVKIKCEMDLEPGLGHGVLLGPALLAIQATVYEILRRFNTEIWGAPLP